MSQCLLLLYDNPSDWQSVSSEEMQKALEKYMAWAQRPYVKDSQRLGRRRGPRDPLGKWQAARRWRALQRDQGGPRRLLHHRGCGQQRGSPPCHGPSASRIRRNRRNTPGLRIVNPGSPTTCSGGRRAVSSRTWRALSSLPIFMSRKKPCKMPCFGHCKPGRTRECPKTRPHGSPCCPQLGHRFRASGAPHRRKD